MPGACHRIADVDCITCHYPPTLSGVIEGKFRGLIQLVNYVGQTYKRTKPWAEIPDASCLQSGCHETRLLSGKVSFQKVVFDHTEHLEDLKRGKQLALYVVPFSDRSGRSYECHRYYVLSLPF